MIEKKNASFKDKEILLSKKLLHADSEKWAKHKQKWLPRGKDVTAYADVKAQDIVLDLGCGMGDITESCIAIGALVVSLDFSKTYLRYMKERIQKANPILADASNLPFKTNSFNKVVSKYMWHNITPHENRVLVVEEVSRILKKNSIAVFSRIPMKLACRVRYYLFRISGGKPPSRPSKEWRLFHFFTYSELQHVFAIANLKILNVRESKVKELNARERDSIIKRFFAQTGVLNSVPILKWFLPPRYTAYELDIKLCVRRIGYALL